MVTPTVKATVPTSLFCLAMILAVCIEPVETSVIVPVAIFYVLLMIHTFFSIRVFATVIRMTPAQVIFDGILVLFYLFIPFHISEPNIFVGLLMLFFAVTTLKYVVLVGKVSHPKLLSYKIIVDSLGFVLCALVYGGVALGYTLTSLWAFTIIFGLATIYLFCIKPLYKLDTISV